MPSSISSGDLGDGVEALVGYAYLKEIMSIEEMVELIEEDMKHLSYEELSYRSSERTLMAVAFERIILEIVSRLS